MNNSFIKNLGQLYKQLPDVSCRGCGICCVSPTCTVSEFIYLFDYILSTQSQDFIRQAILQPIEEHPNYEGNLRCPFLKKKACTIHLGRPAGCRLFGIPSLHKMNISNMEKCINDLSITRGDGSLSFVTSWLEKLFAIDIALYNFAAEPYFVKGFNLQCWLDIYYDDEFDFDIFKIIRQIMHENIDLSFCKNEYHSQTRLKEKVDKISILQMLINTGDSQYIRQSLYSIRDDYPATGTYFYEEQQAFLNMLNDVEKSTNG